MVQPETFDEDWYVSTYPFVKALEIAPAQHYQKFGKRLGLYPSAAAQAQMSMTPLGDPKMAKELITTVDGDILDQTSLGSNEGINDPIETNAFSAAPLSLKTNHSVSGTKPTLSGPNSKSPKARFKSLGIEHVQGRDLIDLSMDFEGGFVKWSGTGHDPQMIFRRRQVDQYVQIMPGSYLFVFQAELISGALQKPRLYLDYGAGFSEAEGHIFELRQANGSEEFFVSITITEPVLRIRFDPSEAIFECYCLLLSIEQFEEATSETPIKLPLESKLGLLRRAAPVLSGSLSEYTQAWHQNFSVTLGSRSPHFAPLMGGSVTVPSAAPKAVAFYLPQFHPFAENDAWWGKGFTEWTNVSKAMPQFLGHYQPRFPGELGFYDLRLPEIMARQIELARQYGIHGFCFHYYWFDGHRLLEKPIEMFLKSAEPEFDFPFCLCWANENWTRRWDGAEDDILMKQNHSAEDHVAIFADLARYFADKRYIRIENKPIILIYRPSIIENLPELVEIWQFEAKKAGFDGVYLIASNSFGFTDPKSIGFDALCEFPPHGIEAQAVDPSPVLLNKNFQGSIFNYSDVVDYSLNRLSKIKGKREGANHFPTVMMGWDNEARKPGRGHSFIGATPGEFHRWFADALDYSISTHEPSGRIVFVNAWNEWAEGTYLEPDREFGYAYLSAISAGYRTLEADDERTEEIVKAYNRSQEARTSDVAVCAHVFYADLIDEMSETIKQAGLALKLDTVLSIPTSWDARAVELAIAKFKPIRIIRIRNTGRDIWPFVNHARICLELGYKLACKIHSKKSPHLKNGDKWRRDMFGALLSPAIVEDMRATFQAQATLGMAAPKSSFATCADVSTVRDNISHMTAMLSKFGLTLEDAGEFVAGSMFWFRPQALVTLAQSELAEADFGVELGAIDGTVAHAFERIFPAIMARDGYELGWYDSQSNLNPYLTG